MIMRNSRTIRTVASGLFIIAAFIGTDPTQASEPAPPLVNYQGVLRDSSGAALSGTFDMIFRLFEAPTGGSAILVQSLSAGSRVRAMLRSSLPGTIAP